MDSSLKMKYFSFRTSVIKWFESHFLKRKFLACIGNAISEDGTLKCTTSLSPWIARFSLICKQSSRITTRKWVPFICR